MKELKHKEFQIQLKQTKILMLYIFTNGCSSCEMMAPAIKEAAKEMITDGLLNVFSMDADKNVQEISEYKVSSVPTIILYIDGVEVGRFEGYKPAEAIMDFVGKCIQKEEEDYDAN